MSESNTQPGLDRSGPEWPRLEAFVRSAIHADARSLHITEARRPLGGASWETIFVAYDWETATGARGADRCVIRRAPASGPMAPYDVRKDVALLSALAESEVPVAPLLAWTEDPGVFLRPFTVTALVEGESHDLSQVERWSRWQTERDALGREMIRVIAALQRFRWQQTDVVQVLGERGSARDRVAWVVRRYLDPLLELAHAREIGLPLWRDMGAWLVRNAPEIPEEELVVVHGDFRFGNFLWQGSRIAAVLDWERSMLGPPMQDLGFLCMPLSRIKDPKIMGKALPFEALAEAYETASGRSIDFGQIQFYAVLWQFLEGVNTTRALIQEPVPMIASGVLVQPNLVARQTLALMEDHDAGRQLL